MILKATHRHWLGVILLALLAPAGNGIAQGLSGNEEQAPTLAAGSEELMAEDHRNAVSKIVILPGRSPGTAGVSGSYGKETDGLIDGMGKGAEIGVIRKEIGGIPVGFPIPILREVGAIFGGVSGGMKRQVQDFRDALTKDLAESNNSPLSNDALATDVFWRLREVPGLKPKVFALSTPIPEDTDAILYVSFTNSSINVDGDRATIEFTATATLRRYSNGEHLYENEVVYKDTDTLSNWTKDDKAAWQDYANYARHYVGREIAAELFERAPVRATLTPSETSSLKRVKKAVWRSTTRSVTPTLAWQHSIDESTQQLPWVAAVNESDVEYDLEIYDKHQLVYGASRLPGREHTVELALEDCKTYRWSVRPSYPFGDTRRSGEWMRSGSNPGNGNMGTAGSVAAAYIQDFASFDVKCGRR